MTASELFRYIAISDQSICPEPVPDRVRRLLNMGVPAVQIRDKSLTDRVRFEWICDIPESRTGKVLINSRADLAVLGRMDGVHRAGSALSTSCIREVAGDDVLVGVSTHSLGEIQNAEQLGADYVCFGPVFPTPSKPERTREDCAGLNGLREAGQIASIPVFALGGITPERFEECLGAGAYGAAGIRALFEPKDPSSAWETIKEQLP